MRLIKKEALKGDASVMQPMIDALNTPVKYVKEPGPQPVNSDVSPLIIAFLNDACSYDYPEFKNALGVFGRSTTGRRLFDTLQSIDIIWYLNNETLDGDGWKAIVNSYLAQDKPRAFKVNLPATLRFVVKGYTIVEYNGKFLMSGSPKVDNKEMYGLTFKINMDLKYAQADDFWTKLNPPNEDYFSGLDMDESYKKEYKKVTHVPFTSLFKSGKDIPLFRSINKSFKSSTLLSLVLLSDGTSLLGDAVGVQGERKKTEIWFNQNPSYTKVEIEGFVVYDGMTNTCPDRPRLLNLIKGEVDSLPEADTYLSAEYDIQAFLYDAEKDLAYKQMATLKMVKIKNDYCGTIINEKDMVVVQKPMKLDLNRLERDNTIVKSIQKDFSDTVEHKDTIVVDTKDPHFSDFVLSFIRSTKDFLLDDASIQRDFIVAGFLEETRYDLFHIKSLEEIPVWNDFLDELEKYDYTNSTTEEFVFDLTFILMLRTLKGKEEILRYRGTLSLELETPIKTKAVISMKAQKTNTDIPRDYIPKPLVNRYSSLEFL